MPQRKGLGGLVDTVGVKLGIHDYLPGPEFKSNGFRLEEMVSNDSFTTQQSG
jgi:hypothetical protein